MLIDSDYVLMFKVTGKKSNQIIREESNRVH